jgi:peptidoglycan lytic transglycosylase
MKRTAFAFRFRAPVCLSGGVLLAFAIWSFGGSAAISPVTKTSRPRLSAAAIETGIASYYGAKFHGRPTASGEIFNMNDLTAAHPRLAFGTRVKVTNLENRRSVMVRINDRGPFIHGRVIDLSQAAATELQMVKRGLAQAKLEVVE